MSIYWRVAGLICLATDRWHFHFLVRKSCWQWGFDEIYYDGPHDSFGIGPLFLVVRERD